MNEPFPPIRFSGTADVCLAIHEKNADGLCFIVYGDDTSISRCVPCLMCSNYAKLSLYNSDIIFRNYRFGDIGLSDQRIDSLQLVLYCRECGIPVFFIFLCKKSYKVTFSKRFDYDSVLSRHDPDPLEL